MKTRGYCLVDAIPKLCLPTLIAIVVIIASPVAGICQHRVVAYYPGWMKNKLPATSVKFEYVTHLNHAFAWPHADGSITAYGEINHPELIAATHQAGRKILISLGGWGQSDGFAPMTADSTVRRKFIDNLIDFCAARGYDGADFDWEFPQNAVQRANLTTLIREVRQAFDQVHPDWLLTMVAVLSNYSGQWHDYAALSRHVDWFNLMAYDCHGSWTNHAGHNAPLYAPPTDFDGSVHQGVQYLRNQRALPPEKIHLGLPFYGREFNASRLYGPSTGGTDLEYSSIASRINSGWDYFWDEVSKVPYLLNTSRTKFVTFDDSLSLSHKCEYAKQNGLAGVMIWALGQDVLNNTQPLLEAVGRAMATGTAVIAEESEVARDFILFNNYPNPFNPNTTIAFQLEGNLPVRLSVFDIRGELVEVLKNGMAPAGMNTVTWQAAGYASGVYFYKLETGKFSAVKKMILTK
jgi:chitinase